MQELTDILRESTGAIGTPYFLLPIDGGDSVFRERVYCYELYHQMRCRWPRETPYILNGEVDKVRHPVLTPLGLTGQKPDLLVHQPGDMEGNHAIIEVKPGLPQYRHLKKDLETLNRFRARARYQRAIYLFYGHFDEHRLANLLRRAAFEIAERRPIEIWTHRAAFTAAEPSAFLAGVFGQA